MFLVYDFYMKNENNVEIFVKLNNTKFVPIICIGCSSDTLK